MTGFVLLHEMAANYDGGEPLVRPRDIYISPAMVTWIRPYPGGGSTVQLAGYQYPHTVRLEEEPAVVAAMLSEGGYE